MMLGTCLVVDYNFNEGKGELAMKTMQWFEVNVVGFHFLKYDINLENWRYKN